MGWNDLTEEISKYFFEGKDYYNYFEKESEISNDILKVELDRVEQAGATKGNNTYNWFYVNIENLTKKIVEVSIIDVTIINSNNRQFSFDDWHKGYFSSGEIYPRAKVEASFNVSRQKAGLLKSGTKVYLKALVNDEEKLFTLIHEKNTLNTKQNDKKGYWKKDDKQEETKYLVKEEENNKILLKSPVPGEVSGNFYFNKDSFLVKPNTVICRVDGIKLKAGSEGYINKICVEDSTLVESGDNILVLNKEKNDQSEPDSPDNNEPNFIIVFWFLLVIIILVALILAYQN